MILIIQDSLWTQDWPFRIGTWTQAIYTLYSSDT